MIFQPILNFIQFLFDGVVNILPNASLNDLPFVGDKVYTALVYVVGMWYAFLETFPYARLPWNLLIWVVLPLELTLLVLKVFLGSRLPAHNAN